MDELAKIRLKFWCLGQAVLLDEIGHGQWTGEEKRMSAYFNQMLERVAGPAGSDIRRERSRLLEEYADLGDAGAAEDDDL